jgi:glycosyltransferase involved in cell wall biosynthesis
MSANASSEAARALKIVHCFRSPVGGIFRHVRDLVHAQVDAGHAVGIVCDSTTGGPFEEALFARIEPMLALGIHRTPMQRHVGSGDVAAAWRTYRIIAGLKPDILHGHGAKGGVYSRLFGTILRAGGAGTARIYSPHGGSLHYDEKTLTGRFFFLAERLMQPLTDHVLFVSEYERQAYRRKVGEPPLQSSLVYNGVSAAEFDPVTVASDAVDFLYIGMMRDLKGPDLFLDALAQAEIRLDRNLTAVMVGDGDGLSAYREQAERLGLSSRVRFHPAMPAREAFALARTVVVPSRAEAMPYIVLEALAAGRALVATRVGGIPEIFGSKADCLVPPEADHLAERMAEAISDPNAFRERMPSREWLQSRFSANAMAEGVLCAYRKALGRNG